MNAALAITTLTFLCATLDRRAFASALARIKHIVPRRPAMPVFESVLLTGSRDALTLYATDADTWVGVAIPATIATPGQMLLPARRLADLIKPGAGTVALSPNRVVVGEATHRIAAGDASTYPLVPVPPRECLATMMRATLARLLRSTTYAMSNDSTRPHLSAMLIERRAGSLTFVATDGHRLASASFPDDGAGFTLLVGRRTIEELERMAAAPGGLVRIHSTTDRVWFVAENEFVSGKLVDATFPAWEQVIPTSHSGRLTLSRPDLQAALKVVGRTGRGGVKILGDRRASRVTLSTDDAEGNLTEVPLMATFEGDVPTNFGVNGAYLRDLVDGLTADDREVTFDLGGELDPIKVDGAHGTVAVVMPMRV